MREMVRYGIILAVICTVAAGLLAGVNSLTKPKIIAQAQAEEEASLREVIPGGINFQAVKSGSDIIYYKVHDKEGKLIAVAFKASGKGYSSQIETMVGMTTDGEIITIKILNQNETPGLGSRVAGSDFTGRFSKKNIHGLSQVQAITGATISSQAVIDSVKNKAEEISKFLKDGK